jgi:hypothetical protein
MHTNFNTITKQLVFSNTYNVFIKIYSDNCSNYELENSKINEMSKQAYKEGRKISVSTSESKLLEEFVFYNNKIYCFVVLDSYIVLYNYLSPDEIGIATEADLADKFYSDNVNHLNNLRSISNKGKVGNITVNKPNNEKTLCTVINTHESFLNYTSENSLPKIKGSNIQFLRSFTENLSITKINPNLLNDKYGTKTSNSNLLNSFTYIYFKNIIIITSYIDSSYLSAF